MNSSNNNSLYNNNSNNNNNNNYNNSNNNNNSSNNNNNNINSNNNNNSKLFFRIFRNIYIKNKIFYYLHLYNIFSKYILFNSFDKIIINDKIKYFEYFKSIYLEDEDEDDLHNFLQLIPTNVESVKIDGVPLFCSNIYSMKIPSHIKNLVLSDILNESENSYPLPNNLQSLVINDVNKQSWKFPQNLQKLTYTISIYRNKFEIMQESDLPQKLVSLKLVNCSLTFYYPLPPQLKKLKIYNRVLDIHSTLLFVNISFPPSVQVLYLHDRLFNRPLDYLSGIRNLLKLELDSSFDQVIGIGVLPQSLTKLVLRKETPLKSYIDGRAFPAGLKTLKLGYGYTFDSLPCASLTNIACNHKLINQFPQSVTQYKFDYQFESFFFEQVEPPNLSVLPDHIRIIKCVSKKNRSFKELFSRKLSNIVLDSYQHLYNIPINSIIPLKIMSASKSITSLDFSYSISDPIPPNTLPVALKSLKLNWYYDQPFLQGTLPQSLESLSLGYYFKTHSLENLPSNLLILEILNCNFNLIPDQLPSTLQILIVPFLKLNDQIISHHIETIFIAEGTSNSPIDYIDFNLFNKLKLYNPKKLNIFKKLNKKLIYK